LKGRPPGTKKSTDPEKKKRKRVARERDLCDVKIKITEYMPGNVPTELFASSSPNASHVPTQQQLDALTSGFYTQQNAAGEWGMGGMIGHSQGKYYTIQRVNGNGSGNGKNVPGVGDCVAGPHRHTLEESDRVKKNSVIRFHTKTEKVKKKPQVSGSASFCSYNAIICGGLRGDIMDITSLCGVPCSRSFLLSIVGLKRYKYLRSFQSSEIARQTQLRSVYQLDNLKAHIRLENLYTSPSPTSVFHISSYSFLWHLSSCRFQESEQQNDRCKPEQRTSKEDLP
jgi:hypothetical protein